MHSIRAYEQRVLRATVNMRVKAALMNNIDGSDLINREDPNPLLGSPLFNALSAAFRVLRKDPGQTITRSTVELPSNHDRAIRIASKIFNANHITDKYARPTDTIPVRHTLDTGIINEVNLADALQKRHESDTLTPVVYNVSGSPAALVQFAPDRAISAKPISWHRIKLPAGVLFAIDQPMDQQDGDREVDDFVVRQLTPEIANGLAPHRFSPIAFQPANIPEVFTPLDGAVEDQSSIVALAPTYTDIEHQLPVTNRIRTR